ncbi:glycosyltransferase family 4 protein [Pseudomonas kurunegalensis]|uniref:glycosyltransferase family 4 protein n=1 Tax=Pseudomonas kurunegalensis TaxID=485880 RepID=UPI0023641B67|nr:glycosyltransferase family 4 protein [Pseudomonas kurunegalensis]MDD2134842.1 glycosyltransferase family 4 protein [Pseudomonas kurunegalensis]
MKKIAMIVWNEFLNDARVLKEAQTLQNAGYQVRVFALHKPGVTQPSETLSDGIQVLRVRPDLFSLWPKNKLASQDKKAKPLAQTESRVSAPMLMLRACGRAWAHLKFFAYVVSYRPDAVHAHDVNTLPTAWLAAVTSRAALVYDAHEISTSREGYKNIRRIVGFIEKHLMPRASGVITTTDARSTFFARAYGVVRPMVLQNRPRYLPSTHTNRIRNELALDKPWPIVLYQGGLQQGRGLQKLVHAATLVPHAYFVFIGGGRLTQSLINLSQSLGVSDRVHFIPTVRLAELPEYTASADIGVQPIENTCFNHFTTDSNKLFEYLIAGLPIVATNLPEIRKVVDTYGVGLLLNGKDTQALATAVKCLVENPAMRKTMAGNSERAALKLNWEEQEYKLVEMYNQLLGKSVGVHS